VLQVLTTASWHIDAVGGRPPHLPQRHRTAPNTEFATVPGRFFYARAADCRRCPLRGDCLSPGRSNRAVVVSDDHPALLRARRRKERWSKEDARLYRRHRWRSEEFHGEAKCWHGLARAVRRGLQNMRIQAFLTAAAVNLKRLAAALAAVLAALLAPALAVLVGVLDHLAAAAMWPSRPQSRGAARA
jgi:hypothetical protein